MYATLISLVGRIGIIDHDRVEVSNLGRQILHSEQTVGMYKAESAAQALLRRVRLLGTDLAPYPSFVLGSTRILRLMLS